MPSYVTDGSPSNLVVAGVSVLTLESGLLAMPDSEVISGESSLLLISSSKMFSSSTVVVSASEKFSRYVYFYSSYIIDK